MTTGVDGAPAAPARAVAAVTVQFHPDWPHGGSTVMASLAADGHYRSQFVTGVSNGGLTAFPGGDRWRWESRLFAGRYDEALPADRPVYGAWNRHADPYGAAVRFGSSYLRLRPEVVARSTFCFPDSVLEPDPADVGGADLLPRLCAMADASDLDPLDDCVETHVHGPLSVADDVEAVVIDPCYVGTEIARIAEAQGWPVELHPGFRADADDLDPGYRGAHVVDLARRLGGELTPAVLGRAARSGEHAPRTVKQLWHCLARFGRQRPRPGG